MVNFSINNFLIEFLDSSYFINRFSNEKFLVFSENFLLKWSNSGGDISGFNYLLDLLVGSKSYNSSIKSIKFIYGADYSIPVSLKFLFNNLYSIDFWLVNPFLFEVSWVGSYSFLSSYAFFDNYFLKLGLMGTLGDFSLKYSNWHPLSSMEIAFISKSFLSHVFNVSFLFFNFNFFNAFQYLLTFLSTFNLFMSYFVINCNMDLTFFGFFGEFCLIMPFLIISGIKEFFFVFFYYYLPSININELYSIDWSYSLSFHYFFESFFIQYINFLYLRYFYSLVLFFDLLKQEFIFYDLWVISNPSDLFLFKLYNIIFNFSNFILPAFYFYIFIYIDNFFGVFFDSFLLFSCPDLSFSIGNILDLWFGSFWNDFLIPLPCQGLGGIFLGNVFLYLFKSSEHIFLIFDYSFLWEGLSLFQLNFICQSYFFYIFFRFFYKYILFLYILIDRAYALDLDIYFPGFFSKFWTLVLNVNSLKLGEYRIFRWYHLFGRPLVLFYLYGQNWIIIFSKIGLIYDLDIVSYWWLKFHVFLWEFHVGVIGLILYKIIKPLYNLWAIFHLFYLFFVPGYWYLDTWMLRTNTLINDIEGKFPLLKDLNNTDELKSLVSSSFEGNLIASGFLNNINGEGNFKNVSQGDLFYPKTLEDVSDVLYSHLRPGAIVDIDSFDLVYFESFYKYLKLFGLVSKNLKYSKIDSINLSKEFNLMDINNNNVDIESIYIKLKNFDISIDDLSLEVLSLIGGRYPSFIFLLEYYNIFDKNFNNSIFFNNLNGVRLFLKNDNIINFEFFNFKSENKKINFFLDNLKRIKKIYLKDYYKYVSAYFDELVVINYSFDQILDERYLLLDSHFQFFIKDKYKWDKFFKQSSIFKISEFNEDSAFLNFLTNSKEWPSILKFNYNKFFNYNIKFNKDKLTYITWNDDIFFLNRKKFFNLLFYFGYLESDLKIFLNILKYGVKSLTDLGFGSNNNSSVPLIMDSLFNGNNLLWNVAFNNFTNLGIARDFSWSDSYSIEGGETSHPFINKSNLFSIGAFGSGELLDNPYKSETWLSKMNKSFSFGYQLLLKSSFGDEFYGNKHSDIGFGLKDHRSEYLSLLNGVHLLETGKFYTSNYKKGLVLVNYNSWHKTVVDNYYFLDRYDSLKAMERSYSYEEVIDGPNLGNISGLLDLLFDFMHGRRHSAALGGMYKLPYKQSIDFFDFFQSRHVPLRKSHEGTLGSGFRGGGPNIYIFDKELLFHLHKGGFNVTSNWLKSVLTFYHDYKNGLVFEFISSGNIPSGKEDFLGSLGFLPSKLMIFGFLLPKLYEFIYINSPNDIYFYEDTYSYAANEGGGNGHFFFVVDYIYEQSNWILSSYGGYDSLALGGYFDKFTLGNTFKKFHWYGFWGYNFVSWFYWCKFGLGLWYGFYENGSFLMLNNSIFGKLYSGIYIPSNILKAFGPAGSSHWFGGLPEYISGLDLDLGSHNSMEVAGKIWPVDYYGSGLFLLSGFCRFYLYFYDLFILGFVSIFYPLFWYLFGGIYYIFSISYEDFIFKIIIKISFILKYNFSGLFFNNNSLHDIIGIFDTTLGGYEYRFVVEKFNSFDDFPLLLGFGFLGWSPQYVGTVGRFFLLNNDVILGYRGQFVKSLFNIYPGIFFNYFKLPIVKRSLSNLDNSLFYLLFKSDWSLNLLTVDVLNHNWTYKLFNYKNLPRVLWFPNPYPHLDLFGDWGYSLGFFDNILFNNYKNFAKYSGYDFLTDGFYSIDGFVITGVPNLSWSGSSLEGSIHFFGYPWKLFKNEGLVGKSVLFPGIGGISLTRYPMPFEIGLIDDCFDEEKVSLKLLLLGTKGAFGLFLSYPNIFLDERYKELLDSYFMEKGNKLTSFGLLMKNLYLDNNYYFMHYTKVMGQEGSAGGPTLDYQQWNPAYDTLHQALYQTRDISHNLGGGNMGYISSGNIGYWLSHLGLYSKSEGGLIDTAGELGYYHTLDSGNNILPYNYIYKHTMWHPGSVFSKFIFRGFTHGPRWFSNSYQAALVSLGDLEIGEDLIFDLDKTFRYFNRYTDYALVNDGVFGLKKINLEKYLLFYVFNFFTLDELFFNAVDLIKDKSYKKIYTVLNQVPFDYYYKNKVFDFGLTFISDRLVVKKFYDDFDSNSWFFGAYNFIGPYEMGQMLPYSEYEQEILNPFVVHYLYKTYGSLLTKEWFLNFSSLKLLLPGDKIDYRYIPVGKEAGFYDIVLPDNKQKLSPEMDKYIFTYNRSANVYNMGSTGLIMDHRPENIMYHSLKRQMDEVISMGFEYILFKDFGYLLLGPLYNQISLSPDILLGASFKHLPLYYNIGFNLDKYIRGQEWVNKFWLNFLEETGTEFWSIYGSLLGDQEDWSFGMFWGFHISFLIHSFFSYFYQFFLVYIPIISLFIELLDPWIGFFLIIFIYLFPKSIIGFYFSLILLIFYLQFYVFSYREDSDVVKTTSGWSDYRFSGVDYGWWFSPVSITGF